MSAYWFLAAFLVIPMASSDAAAQPEAPALRPSLSVEPSWSVESCAGRARLYAAGGLKVWVVRKGTLRQDNPLRPLSEEMVLVFQVTVNGRVATAYGPDPDHLRQGASPARLEEGAGHKIEWSDGAEDFPSAIRVVAEDGRVLLGPLPFQSCGDAPRAAAAPHARKPRSSAATRTDAPRQPRNLPQGAIPE